MSELLTAAQMRAIEQAAIHSGAVTGLELMERAGRGVVEAIFEAWPEVADQPGRAVVLCGPGNNGGDGYVIARLLKALGWIVDIFQFGDAANLPADAKENHNLWQAEGGVRPWHVPDIAKASGDLLVDAVFGAGLTRAAPAEVLAPLVTVFEHDRFAGRVVAVDAPTGLCMDSGTALSAEHGAALADLTVTFHQARPGHFLNDGPRHCGRVVVKSIGLEGYDVPGTVQYADEQICWALGKSADRHKYGYGHALVLSGGAGRTGAARLAARGALRVGAGLVTLGVPPAAQMEVACQITAVMLNRIDSAGALAKVLTDSRFNALCLGPGMGTERARELVPVALAALAPGDGAHRAVVLDADAITAYEAAPETLFEMLHAQCVLTPHLGEFSRLFPDIAGKIGSVTGGGPAYSKVDAARDAARRAGCTVLLKGADTVIADQSGACAINAAVYDRAAPWLATAGSGDVLAGFVTGMLARGEAPLRAAEIAAWLHVECARRFGPGLIAEDLPEMLPGVLKSLRA